MLTKGGGIYSYINSKIKYRTCYYSHKFGLCMLSLEMKSSEYSFLGFAMIVLYKFTFYPSLSKLMFLIAFHKKSSLITKDLWSDKNNFWNCSRRKCKSHHIFERKCVHFISLVLYPLGSINTTIIDLVS